MAFEKTSNLSVGPIGQSLQIDQSSPEGTQGGTFCSSLLVYNNTKRAVSPIGRASPSGKDFKVWGPKEARAYQRINTGYKIAMYTGSKLRFMTLTTSKEARDRDLKEDANTLIKRVRRRYKARPFEYFRVRTNEGNGVLHIIYRGPYISRTWLKAQWEDIHASWNVDIRSCQRYHRAYIVNQYLCSQDASYTRYSMSGTWVLKGALAVWKSFCKWYPSSKLDLWDDYLHRRCNELCQRTLDVGWDPPPSEAAKTSLFAPSRTEFLTHTCVHCHETFAEGEGRWNEAAGGYLCYRCYPKGEYGKNLPGGKGNGKSA